LAIVADMSNDRLRIFSPESKVPEIMFMRLPGFAAQSVLLAFLICALLYLADRMGAVSSARALSISAMRCGFLSWSAFYLQMSFIAGEMEPPGVIPIFGVYGSVVLLFVLIAAVGRLIYASGVSGPVRVRGLKIMDRTASPWRAVGFQGRCPAIASENGRASAPVAADRTAQPGSARLTRW
jgi:hypothetical protein